MKCEAREVELSEIAAMREVYRTAMNCQIIHDSIHGRPGWTREWLLTADGEPAGYGSLAVAGPWRESPTVYEFFVLPAYRLGSFQLFTTLLAGCAAVKIETQSNDRWLTDMLHTFGEGVEPESILFEDVVTTSIAPAGVAFRAATAEDKGAMAAQELDESAKWVVTVAGEVAGAGDILYHYNRPYGDVYMAVGAAFRRRGVGAFLVQELKRVCREGGSVPAARCNVRNVASRQTLQKAGFAPCGHILTARVLTSSGSTPA